MILEGRYINRKDIIGGIFPRLLSVLVKPKLELQYIISMLVLKKCICELTLLTSQDFVVLE